MGLTFKAVLHPREREDGTRRVQIRLTKDRKSVFLDAGFTVLAKHWNPTGSTDKVNWIRGGERDSPALNSKLERLLRSCRTTSVADPSLSAEELRERLLKDDGRPVPEKVAKANPNAPPTDFVKFAEYYVRERAKKDKYNTVKFYRDAARNLSEWRHGKPLPFSELTKQHVAELGEWLLAQPKIFAGTARDRIIKLSTIARAAEKLGLVPAGRQPFADLELPKSGNKRPPRRPTEDEQLAVLALDISTIEAPRRYPDYRHQLEIRRDIWELQYLIRGSRCGDMLQLRERDVRPARVSFTETKTGKLKGVARSEAINAILARYPATGNPMAFVFPVLDHTRPYAAENPTQAQREMLAIELATRINWVNDGLRALARVANVPEFTSHSARHIFGEKAYSKLRDLRTLQAFFNHSHISTTERYLKTLGFDALDEATERVLG